MLRNGLKIQWVKQSFESYGTVRFPLAFSSASSYTTDKENLWIQGIAATSITSRTAQTVTFNWDTKTVRYGSIIAIGY